MQLSPSSKKHEQSQICVSILASFWKPFGILFLCFFGINFWMPFWMPLSRFLVKMVPKKVRPKGIADVFGSPKGPKATRSPPKMSYSPRPFSNRMSYGGLDAPKMHPGPSRVPVLEHFERISGTICNIVRSRFQVESHPASPDPTFRGGISKQGKGGGKPPPWGSEVRKSL